MSTPGYPLTPGSQWSMWDLLNYLIEMFSERVKPFNCGFFPPGAGPAYPLPVVDSVVDNHDGTLTASFSNLSPDWTSGQWTGAKTTAGCPGAPLRYNLYIFGNLGPPTDPLQQVSGYIVGQTQGSGVGTLTISPASGFLNAVTANFIPSLSYLSGKPYAIVQVGYPSFVDRRWTRPNDQEQSGTFDQGWTATLNYSAGPPVTETFSSVGDAPYYPITVTFQAVSGAHKMVGTLSLNADGTFSSARPLYSASTGTNTPSLFDHTIWNGVSFSLATPTFDKSTGIGQVQQFRDSFSPSPYDNAPGDPPQPPYTKWKTDLLKGNDFLAQSQGGSLLSVQPDPATFPLSLGHDYTSTPTVTPSGGGGSGAAVTAVRGTSTAVVYLLITNPGAGYIVNPNIAIASSGSSFAAGHLTISAGAVNSATLDISGTGFPSEPTVTVDAPPGGGTQAVVRAILGVNTIAGYVVTTPGLAYVSPPSLAISGGGGSGAAAVAKLDGSTKNLIRGTIAGSDANIIWLGKRPDDPAYSIPSAPLTLDAGQEFIVIAHGGKGMPGRHGDEITHFNRGATQPAVMHQPDGSLTIGAKKSPTVGLAAENNEGTGCDIFLFSAEDIDVVYPSDFCNCGKWGLPVFIDYYKTWRALQVAAIQLLQGYADPATFGLSTPPSNYTVASILAAIGANPLGLNRVSRRRVVAIYPATKFQEDQDDDGNLVSPPVVDPGGALPNLPAITLAASFSGGALTSNTTFAYRVSWFNSSGETLASAEQTIATAATTNQGAWNSGTAYSVNDYVTAGSGTFIAIAANTNHAPPENGYWVLYPGPDHCSITVGWPFQVGAQGANVYGRTSGAEQLIAASVAMPTLFFLDDGSITPGGALPTSNTTANACNGAGRWIKKQPSTGYISRDEFGYVGSGDAFVPGELARYMGNNPADPFPGGDRITVYSPVDDRFFQGTKQKVDQLAHVASRSGSVSFATPSYLLDTSKNWWTDDVNTGTLRVQGGIASGGGTTSLTRSSITGDALCWWNAARYIGLGGIFCGFILEVYKDAMLAGWTVAADGTATYSSPSAPGHTGTSGTTPTISAVVPGSGLTVIHAIGTVQEIWIDGNHFDPACTAVLTNTDSSQSFTLTLGTTGFGEIALSFDFGFVAANWSLVVTNPGPHASSPFTFSTHAVYRVPITTGTISSGTGSLGFTAVSGLTVAANDGFLIREPAFEMNKWQQRDVKLTLANGSSVKLHIRFSDNQGIYFDAQASAPVGAYQILERDTSEVVKNYSSAPTDGRNYTESIPGSVYWADPYILDASGKIVPGSNTDPRGGGNFLLDLKANLETKVVGYGYWMAGDDFTPDIPNQIYKILQLADMTFGNPACRNIPAIGATAENNSVSASFGNFNYFLGDGTVGPGLQVSPLPYAWPQTISVPYSAAFSGTVAQFDDNWSGDYSNLATGRDSSGNIFGSSTPDGTGNPPNYAVAMADGTCPEAQIEIGSTWIRRPGGTAGSGTFVPIGPNVARIYSYLEDSGIPVCLTSQVSFWAHAIITTGDPDQGASAPWPDQHVYKFDAQSTPLKFRLWVKVAGPITSAKDGTGIVFSPRVGAANTDLPAFTQPDDPTGHEDDSDLSVQTSSTSSITSGYLVDSVVPTRSWKSSFVYT